MRNEETDRIDKETAERIRKYLPTFPCIRCKRWLDENGVPKCLRAECVRWQAFYEEYFDHNKNINRLRDLMNKEKFK